MNRRPLFLVACATAMILVLSAAAGAEDAPKQKIRVAVVGDSISSQAFWPSNLAKHLGDDYEVKAFTANGLTVIRGVARTIWRRYEYRHALDYKPNVVLLMFGANAGKAKPGQWAMKGRFIEGYTSLVALYKGLPTKPKIYLCLPTWCEHDFYGISADVVNKEVVPTVARIAKDTGVLSIDTNTPLKGRTDAMKADGIYLTSVGCEVVGRAVYTALTGKELPPVPVQEQKTEPEPAGPPLPEPVKQMAVGDVVELTPADVADHKGDGADGRGNTPDDTWQFWFELAHNRQAFHRLSLATATMSPQQRKNGIPRKVDGPIAGNLPNPNDTEGWIFGSDWDGGYEGFWGDRKANQVLAHPFVEKNSHLAVAVTFRVPADGAYEISGKVTDLAVVKHPTFTGILWHVEVVKERHGDNSPKADRVAGKGGPIGDGVGPASQDFKLDKAALKKGELIRFVIDPNNHWGTDLTRIDYLRIKRVPAPAASEKILDIPSPSFKKSFPATVVLPASYNDPAAAERKYPLLVLLHGADGGHRDWPKEADLGSLANKYECVIVAPTVGPNSWWIDYAGNPPNFGETFVAKELMAELKSKFRIADGGGHWIAGASMGGYGALRIGLAHADLFSAVGGLSACMKPSRWGDKWNLNAAMGPAARRADAFGPPRLEALGKKSGPVLSLICGRRDSLFAKENQAAHKALQVKGVEHQWLDVDGRHNWEFWAAHLPKQLEYFHAQAKKSQ